MPDEPGPVPGQPELETREGVLPDGTRMVLAVKPGLSQDEVDLLAAQLWQETPET